jgi:benzoate/toluate 1,2-dioxygenase beta subunit
VQASNELRTWAGRATYRLRRTDGGLRIAAKTMELVNSSVSLPTLAFNL